MLRLLPRDDEHRFTRARYTQPPAWRWKPQLARRPMIACRRRDASCRHSALRWAMGRTQSARPECQRPAVRASGKMIRSRLAMSGEGGHRHSQHGSCRSGCAKDEGTARCRRTWAEHCQFGRSAKGRKHAECSTARATAGTCAWCGVASRFCHAGTRPRLKRCNTLVAFWPTSVMFRR